MGVKYEKGKRKRETIQDKKEDKGKEKGKRRKKKEKGERKEKIRSKWVKSVQGYYRRLKRCVATRKRGKENHFRKGGSKYHFRTKI